MICSQWPHGRFEDLGGYQTVLVNWGLNTKLKRAFFDRGPRL